MAIGSSNKHAPKPLVNSFLITNVNCHQISFVYWKNWLTVFTIVDQNMYSSNPYESQRPPAPSAPPTPPPVKGVPVMPQNYSYGDNYRPQAPGQFHANTPGSWSTGLCGCFSDVSNCKFNLFSENNSNFDPLCIG